uniref:Ion transport domain-containing protein n=1 Tax=Plectus sambesii TaxID=2011161 RepID=A0A914ULC6_9BILA
MAQQQQANGGPAEKVDAEPTGSSSAETTTSSVQPGALARIAKTVHMLLKSKNRVASAAENNEQSEFMKKHGLVQKRTEVASDEASSGAVVAGPSPSFIKRLAGFVIDPSQNVYYWWTTFISLAVIYNLLVVVARLVFNELQNDEWTIFWLSCDLLSDFIYVLDFLIHFRTGFLEQGLLVRDLKKLAVAYIHSRDFKISLASLVPLDYIPTLLNLRWPPFLRLNRLLRIGRVQEFIVRTETRSSFPNVFRVGCVIFYIVVIIHWNGCIYFAISEWMGLNNDTWVYGSGNSQSLPEGTEDSLLRRYVYSFYWSTLTLTTIGEVPQPVKDVEIVFVTVDFLIGVLIFATIVGNVGSMIANMSAARTEFQNKIDAIKQYMELRRVGKELEERVIMWFDYLWSNTHSLSDEDVLKTLPAKLQAEIAMHVHFETLRKVRIFQDCEAGLLAELVLKLQLQVSPFVY